MSIFGCEKSSLNASGSEIDTQQYLHNRAPLIVYDVKLYDLYMPYPDPLLHRRFVSPRQHQNETELHSLFYNVLLKFVE